MNVMFFDVVPTNMVRFFSGVVDALTSLDPSINFHFLVEEDDHNDINFIRQCYPKAEKVSYVEDRSVCFFNLINDN